MNAIGFGRPRAHTPVFELAATSAARSGSTSWPASGKQAIQPTGRPIAGHTDWSGKHFRFSDGAITAIYDRDSLAIRTEPKIVGMLRSRSRPTSIFPAFDEPRPQRRCPRSSGSTARRRDTPLSAERQQVAACALLVAAYTARCEYCALDGYDADDDPDSFTTALRIHSSADRSI